MPHYSVPPKDPHGRPLPPKRGRSWGATRTRERKKHHPIAAGALVAVLLLAFGVLPWIAIAAGIVIGLCVTF